MNFLTSETFSTDLVFVLRIIIAGFCGAAIGYEREKRQKSAGIRTHIIVSMASSLMMIISKHGFDDVLGEYIKLDPARVSAGIVTAIGFLGSGVIFTRNKSVSGLTTSAGIWATVGVGMSIGCGMYILGVISSLLIVFVEVFCGKTPVWLKNSLILIIELKERPKSVRAIKEDLENMGFEINGLSYKAMDEGYRVKFYIKGNSHKEMASYIDRALVDENVIKMSVRH